MTKPELMEILEDLPQRRRNLNSFRNLEWLERNFLYRFKNPPRATEAVEFIRELQYRKMAESERFCNKWMAGIFPHLYNDSKELG